MLERLNILPAFSKVTALAKFILGMGHWTSFMSPAAAVFEEPCVFIIVWTT